MSNAHLLLVFLLDEQRYGLSLDSVERITRAAYVTPLPKAPDIVIGVFNLQGRIIPVMNMRRRFRMTEQEITPGDQFIIARTAKRSVALVADTVTGVAEISDQNIVAAEIMIPGIEHVAGVAKLGDDLLLIHDLDMFLSLDEASALNDAMSQEVEHGT